MVFKRNWILNDDCASIVISGDDEVEGNDQFDKRDFVFTKDNKNLENPSALI